MAINEELRPSTRPAFAGAIPLRLVCTVGLLVTFAAALLAGAALRESSHATPFLQSALGSPLPAAPDRHTPAGVRIDLPHSGYKLDAGNRQTFQLTSANPTGGTWRHHERGAVRSTPFGTETVVVDGEVVEQFLTVSKRTGPTTWRWKLDAGTLKPSLRPDGSVLVSTGNVVAGFRIAPPAVLDRRGHDVSPVGTAWGIERRDGSWSLTLALDDRELPLPYVIDPATIALRQFSATNNGAGGTTLTITKPVGLAVDDQMIAQVTVRNGTNAIICAPPGWTSVDRRNSSTVLAQEVFRKTATAADVAAANFAFTLDNTAGCASPLSQKASGGIIAYYGVDNAAPISAVNGQANASNVNIAAPTIPPPANDVILGIFGTATGTSVTPPTLTPTFTERWDTASTGGTAATRTTSELATALSAGGATGTKTAVAAAAAVNIGQLVSLKLDSTPPTAPALTVTESDSDTFVSGTTLYYRPGGNGGSFTVDATTTETGSGVQYISFPGLTGGFTPITTTNDATSPYSQAYSWAAAATDSGAKTVTAQDNATNTNSSTFTLTSDSTAPATTVTTSEGANAGLQHFVNTGANAYTLYYNPSATGDLTFAATATDGGSGMAQVAFPAVSVTGFTGAALNDTGAPFVSNTYTFTNANVAAPGSAAVVSTDNVGNATTDTITFNRDATVPTGGALTVNSTVATGGGSQSYDSDGAFTIGLRTDYTDAASGLASSTLTREAGTLSADACSAYGAPATLVGTPAQSGLATGCYRYVLTGTDNVGNTVALTTVVKVDTSAPGAPSLTLFDSSADVHTTGTTAFYRPAGSGSFDVTAAATDSESGILDYSFPALAGFTGSGSGATRTYTLATPTEPNGSKSVTARNPALLSSGASTFTLTADSTAPTGGALTVNGTAATGGGTTSTSNGSFSLSRTDYADAGSGLGSSTLTRDSAPFTNDGCGTYSGSPTTIVGTPAQSLGAGCYEYVLTGTDAVGNTTNIRTVVQVHGAATQIVLTGSTANLTSGATRVLTATLRDAAGNAVISDSSAVIAFAKQSGAGTVSGSGNATVSSGVATKTVTGVLVGSVTMEATAAGLTTGTLGAFTVAHGAAAQIQLTGSTADLASGANRVLTATIQDAAGNTVASDNSTVVSFAKASGAGTVSGTGNATASSGVASKTVTGVLAGSVTMEATASGLTTGMLGAFTVVHGAAAQIALTGSTANLTSGATRALTATLQDAAGNTVTGDNSTVVSFVKASGAGTVSGTGNATAAAGVATKTVTGVLAGSVTMEATSAGLTTGTLGAFTVVHAAAADIQLTGSTADLTSGAARVLTATIVDPAGNTVTSDSSTVVAFAKASGAGNVTGTGNATAASGVATKTITGVLAGSVTMEATAAGLTTGTLGAFTVVHGSATEIVLTGVTTDLTSGATRVLTATIKDAAGNTVTADNSTVVSFAKASGTGTVSGSGNATAASGIATKTITGVLAGPVTMEATASGLTTGTLGSFTVVHAAAADIVLTGSTADLTSGTNRVLTATIVDPAGNTVTSDNSTVVAFAKASGTGTVSGTGSATATAGVAIKTITGVLAGPVTMEATATGLTTGTLGSFTVLHGAATQIQLTGSTADLAAGANRGLTATLQDAAGNTVTSDNTTVVTFAKASGTGSISGTGNATASGGVATKTITGNLAGSVAMEATAAGLTDGTLGSFNVVAGPAAQIALTGSTANLASGATRVLTATIQDAGGNVLTSDNSTVITFAKQSGAGTVSGAGNATASAGVATKTVTGALAGPITLEATASGLTTGTLAFTVVHGPAADILLTGSTADLASGASRMLTATIVDAAGNTVTSDNSTVISFAQASGPGTVGGTGNATGAGGVATKSLTGQLAGSVTIEATALGLTTGTLGAFTVVPGAAAQIALTGSTADLASGSSRVLTATIQDAAGNTVTSDNSTVVAFAKASGAGTVSGTGNATATGGVATETITGVLAGSVTMEATAAGLTSGTLGAFTVVHGAAAQATLTGATTDLTSGATRVLTATIQDAAGNTVTADNSTVVAFAKAVGAGTVSGVGNATASAGVATKTITGVLAGSVTMEATAAGLTTGTLGAFTVVHGAAADIVLTGSTADLTSGANRVLTATIVDAAGNTVTSDNSTVVSFAKASGAGTVSGTGNATASGGVATKTITGVLTGSLTMGATAAGLTTGTLGAFTVVHGAAAQIALTGSTANLTSGATRVLTATIVDPAGNTVTSDSSTVVAFAKASGAGTVSGAGNATASGGVATKTVTGILAGPVTMEATATGLTTGTLGAFTVVHAAAADIVLTGSTADLASGATRVLTATIVDPAGNTVTSDNTTVVAFAKASGAGTLSGTGNATATGGVATKTITGVLAGSATMEATAAGLTTGTLGSFTVVHGAATQIALTGSTANLTSGATRLLTATIQDAAGNTVTSDNTTVVAFAKASGAGTVSGTGTATAANGVATKTVTGVLAGPVTIEATAAGLTTGTLGAFTVVHGAATQIQLTGSTADLSSGTNRVLTATIVDPAGNTVTSDNSTVVAFAKASGTGTVSGTGNATATAGVATKTITGVLTGPVTMEATATGLTTGTLAAFTIVHGAAAQIALTDSGSTASGDNHTLTATIQDAAGNTVTSDNTTVVTFAKTGGAGTVTGFGNATASSGIATRIVVNAASGQIDLDAQAAGLTTGTASYTIVAGSGSTLTSTITASPTSIVANGSSTAAITVQLKDVAGNDLTGSGGVVTLGLTGTGSLSAVTDNGDGSYAATLTAPTTVDTATVTGTLNAVALAATAGVTYVHGPATQLTLAESGSNVAGDAHTLTATITDANGNTVTSDSSTVVAFAKTGGAGTVAGLGNATAANGVATKNLTNRLAGQIDVDAQAAGLTAGTASYTITVGPVSAAASDSTVVAAPGVVYANGSDAATITVTLRDAGGNGISGKTVTLAQGSGGSSISGGGSTNASGVVTFAATNTAVETVTYTATDTTDAITLADDASVDFTFADGTPPTNTVSLGSATRAWLTGTTLYYNGAVGGSFTLSSAVTDGGSGPASASYPAVARPGWVHGAEAVSTPAGGPYASSAFSFNAGSTGSFTYDVTASDSWAPPNTTVTTLNVTEDSTAPAASIACNSSACPVGSHTASPVSVTLAAPDAGAGLDQIRYTTDGTDPTILTGNVYASAFNVAAEGVTTVKYRAFDRIGNDTGVLAQTVQIDTVSPGTTIDSAPNPATQDTTPTFAFSSAEAGSTFQVRLDGGAWTTETSPLTLGPLAENTYTFEVRATDVAGNVDSTPASFTFTVDTTPANTTITSSPPAASSSTGASFSFTASDAAPGFECRLDGGAFADCSSPKSYSGLTEAAHTFEVRAEDAAGNVDATPATHAWTVDLTAPNTSFLSTPGNPSANQTPTFGLGSTETPSTFECDLDGGGWSTCSTPFTTPSLGDGSHTLKARATDAAGNTDASEITFTWLVDATAPTGSITSPADGADVGGTIVLASNSADTGGSGIATVVFQRSPAGVGSWTSQAASWDTTAQADGDYDVRVATTDNAGNAFTSATITITVDNTDPTLSVVAPNPVNLATADPATVSATATDDGSGVANVRFDQCAEDSPACVSDSWVLLGVDTGAPYQASWPIPSDGPRLLRVRATDNAGKQKTELVLITVDRIRPTGALTAPAAGANLRGTAVALTATASDTAPGAVNTVTFQRSPAGAGSWTDVSTDSSPPYTGTLDTTGHTDGLYDLRVFTTDAAGNAEATPATVQVRVDNTAPTGAVTGPAAGANVSGTIALTSNSADAGSGVATVQFQRSPAGAGTWTNQAASFDTSAVADGQYDLRVTTTDNAGNSFTSAATTIRVDNTLPSGAVTAPAAGANVRGTIALTSNSADAGSGVATVQFQRSPAGAGTWTNQAASFDTSAVADGQYDLRVTTTDNAGNSFTSATITIRVDNTLPTGSITAPANGAEIGVPPVALTSDSADLGGSGVASVVFERSPAGAATWSVTAASWNTASGPDAVADGGYDLRVKTTDNAGNVFTSPAITVLVDHTAPTTTASLAPGTPSNAPVTVSFSANDGAGSGVSVTSYRVDGGSLQLGSAVIVPAPGDHSNDGSHLVEYFATDEVGNVETLKSVTVVIDTTAPGGSGADPGDYLRGIANLSYSTGASDVSSVQFQFSPAGAGAWSNVGAADISPPYEAAWNTTLVADGQYDLRAVVTDTTGNFAHTLLPGLPKTVDNTAPAGSVTAPAGGAYVSGAVAVDASAADGAAPLASGVSAVRFEVKPAGAGAYSVFGTQTVPVVGSTYRQTLATGALADGLAELRVVVTDVAGNETTSAPSTINVDNDAPVVTLDDPGSAIGSSVNLTASSSADTTDVTFRYRPVGDPGVGTAIGSDPTAPFAVTWSTPPAAEQQWELIAVATDGGGNVATSAPRTVLVDRTQPTGGVTAPAAGATVGGPAVALAASAADTGGSGVTLVEWQVKEFGAGSFSTVASDASAPYQGTWNSTPAPDGATEIRALVTDAAGNVRTTGVIPFTVDSTGPSVTLTDPGAVLSGTAALDATTGGGAVRVQFSVSPANAATWTQIAEDAIAPFGTPFDTTSLADGLYDLRAIGFDGLGNPSTASIREDVRLDNTAPQLVSAAPADGSVSASANQIVLTASEPVTAPGALFDGAAAPAPAISGNQLTFSTGTLADGLHVLSGELEDASGTRVPFRVAVTIESTPSVDPPPVERSITSSGDWTLTVPGGLVTVRMPQAAWPTPPTPQDYILVLRVDAGPVGAGFAPGTQIVDVTARWALAGTYVTEFNAPIEIIFSNPSGVPAIPGYSPDGSTWQTIAPLSAPLAASQRDGFTGSGSDVHVWTRHLTHFGLLLDNDAPTAPRDLAGVVRDDGLTLRWIPGTDASGQIGNILMFVNGEPYREFGPTEFEAKLGAFSVGDTRSFTLAQKDAAGNVSPHTAPLRAVPPLAGKSLAEAAAALGAAGFKVGNVGETAAAGALPGTVVEPAGIQLALASTPIDLVVATAATAPQTRLAFSVAGSKRIELKKKTTIAVRIKVSKPARVTVTLRDSKNRRLHTWALEVKAGANVVRLRLPAKIRRPGTFKLTWIARSGAETVSRTITLTLVGPAAAHAKPKRDQVDVVLAGATPPGNGLRPGQKGMPRRVSSAAGADQTFDRIATTPHEIEVVVVDSDAYDTRFVADLRAVFPRVRVIAISREPSRRVLVVRAGATLALPRNTTPSRLARAIALIAGS